MADATRPIDAAETPRSARREFLAQLAGIGVLAAAGGARIPEALATDPLLDALIQPSRSRFGTGGMMSKVRASAGVTSESRFAPL